MRRITIKKCRTNIPMRNNRKIIPGSLFGEKHLSCVRCKKEYPESKLKIIPSNTSIHQSYFYVCSDCNQLEE